MPLADNDRPKGAQRPLPRPPKTRIPVTITIDPQLYAIAERSVQTSACSSIDEFVEVAITVLENLKNARRRLAIALTFKGRKHKDIMRRLDDELVHRFGVEELKERRKTKGRKTKKRKRRAHIAAKSAH